MSKIRLFILAAALTGLAGAAGASETSKLCRKTDPAAAPVGEEQIRSTLAAQGYTEVRSIGQEDGCIEAKGLTKDGKRFEVYLHPTTGEIVKSK